MIANFAFGGILLLLPIFAFLALETLVCYCALRKQRNPWTWGSLTLLVGPLALSVALLEPAPLLSGISPTWGRAMLTALGIDGAALWLMIAGLGLLVLCGIIPA